MRFSRMSGAARGERRMASGSSCQQVFTTTSSCSTRRLRCCPSRVSRSITRSSTWASGAGSSVTCSMIADRSASVVSTGMAGMPVPESEIRAHWGSVLNSLTYKSLEPKHGLNTHETVPARGQPGCHTGDRPATYRSCTPSVDTAFGSCAYDPSACMVHRVGSFNSALKISST